MERSSVRCLHPPHKTNKIKYRQNNFFKKLCGSVCVVSPYSLIKIL